MHIAEAPLQEATLSQTASPHRLLRAEPRTSAPVEEKRWAGDPTLVRVGSSPHAAARAKFNKGVQQDPAASESPKVSPCDGGMLSGSAESLAA